MIAIADKATKRDQLITAVRDQILNGSLKPGDKLAPERTLAEELAVSRVTVRSALKQLEEDGLIQRVQGRGTLVTDKGGSQGKANAICMLIRNPHNDLARDPYIVQVSAGLHQVCDQQNISLRLIRMPAGGLTELKQTTEFDPTQFVGFIAISSAITEEDRQLIEQAQRPLVMMGDSEQWSHVDIDNTAGGYLATQHLISTGARRIAWLASPMPDNSDNHQLIGHQNALAEAGISFEDDLIREVVPWQKQSGRDAMQMLLDSGLPFDGLVCMGDWATVGAMQVMQAANVKVPEQVRVIMYDDFPWVAEVIQPSLTAIRQPYLQQAADAARMVLQMGNDRHQTQVQSRVLQPQLIIRRSCGIHLA